MIQLGLHAQTKAGNQFFGIESAERSLQVDVMRQMNIKTVKLLSDSDSQWKAAKWLIAQGLSVIVRFYKPPVALEPVPYDQLKPFADVGVKIVEGYINEPEIEWGRPPTLEVITSLAQAHIKFADQCAHAGLKPLTPAIQGDRVFSWFEPMVERIVLLGRQDALEGSYIAVHPRPSNNLPDTPPPGFCPRSYELFDDVVVKHLGHSLDTYLTEFGYEPGDAANTTLPKIDYTLHAKYNVQLAQMTYRPCVKAVYYWTWLNDWFDSGWWRGSIEASLPVVKAFITMQTPVIPPPPKPPEPPAKPIAQELEAIARRLAEIAKLV